MFKKALKSQSKLRMAIFGPSGSGKTFSALRIATGIGGKIAVIDTEYGSASKYADIQRTGFEFDVAELDKRTIDEYCKFIEFATGKYDILIVDSMSHAWQELLQEVDQIAHAKFRGNTWSAWQYGTPKQKKLINAMLKFNFNGHFIATMRSKTEWTTSKDQSGKTTMSRVGLAPEQGKGIEYEFDILMEITTDHYATIIKDRSGMFQDQIIEKPGEDFGKKLIAWLNDGEAQKTVLEPIKEAPASLMRDALKKFDAVTERILSDVNALPDPLPKNDYVFRKGPYKGISASEISDLTYLIRVINAPNSVEIIRNVCLGRALSIVGEMDDWVAVSNVMKETSTPNEIREKCLERIEKLTEQGAI